MPEYRRARVVVKGRVQGVGFRWFARDAAKQLGVFGWVRNGREGSVEVMVEGQWEAVDRFLGKLQDGPPAAEVTDCRIDYVDYVGEFSNFEIKHS